VTLAFIAGIFGIVGGAFGGKKGGAILIIGGILSLVGTSLYGLLPCVLLIVGGALAFREKKVKQQT
jgi:hypothetical protein